MVSTARQSSGNDVVWTSLLSGTIDNLDLIGLTRGSV
jgi:hypothetical protein